MTDDHTLDNVLACPECGKSFIGIEEHYGVIDCPDKTCKGRICCYITTPVKNIHVQNGVAYRIGTCGCTCSCSYEYGNADNSPAKDE